jgi:magnesium and cobalt transporter
MIEGVMQVAEMQVRDIMIPRAQMDVVDINDPRDEILPMSSNRAFALSRVDGDRDNVIGILLAKDLLRLCRKKTSNLRDHVAPGVFVPESKRLNVLLREFRASRNHIAIVVDEYGGVAGLVTIEDVLEQIVGDIEDEYDYDEAEDNILQEAGMRRLWRVKAQTEIADLNEALGAAFPTKSSIPSAAWSRMPSDALRVERLPQNSLQLG